VARSSESRCSPESTAVRIAHRLCPVSATAPGALPQHTDLDNRASFDPRHIRLPIGGNNALMLLGSGDLTLATSPYTCAQVSARSGVHDVRRKCGVVLSHNEKRR
jgi:hypothetical protein